MTKKEKIEKLIESARLQIGKPYKYGVCYEESEENPQAFDCSSFTQFVFKQIGINIPRTSILQATLGKEIDITTAPIDLKPGDLIFFEGERGHYRHDLFNGRKLYIGHVGLCTSAPRGLDPYIIGAANNHAFTGVVEHSLCQRNSPYTMDTITLIKRIV